MIVITYLFNIEKNNMIKKLFSFLLISCFVLFWFSFVKAQDFLVNSPTYVGWSVYSWHTFTFQPYWNFLTDNDYKYFFINHYYNYFVSISWINKKLYFMQSENSLNVLNQGFVSDTNFWVWPIEYDGGGCGYQNNTCLTSDEFYNSDIYNNPDWFAVKGVLYGGAYYCFLYSDLWQQVCFYGAHYDPNNQFTWSLNFSINPKPEDFTNSSLSDYVWNSPFTNSSDNWPISYTWTFEDEIDSTIAYYEYRYNWNEKMCYVWTDDLEHSLRYFIWHWVPYYFWSGATLYQLYYSIYNTFGNNKIHNVWSFINSWLINYWMVYDTIWEYDVRYVAHYNWPDTDISILYTWYTNELFLGNLGAIYNMASILYNNFWVESTMGEEMIYYCDLKLNYHNYKDWSLSFTWLQDLVNPWIIDRIGDYVDRDMPWSTWFIMPNIWSGSIWDWIISSWYNIPDDVNPTNFFKDYFEKINNIVRNFNPVWTWIIPDWILFPMLFLIFYRIIRH